MHKGIDVTAEDQSKLPVLSDLISADEVDELALLMLDFDPEGLLDLGELDGFLSALAVGLNPTTLDRWWTTITGANPAWTAPDGAQRAQALIERYYGMVQARVSVSPFDLGADAVPPLFDDLEGFDDADADDADADDDTADNLGWLEAADDDDDDAAEIDSDEDEDEDAAEFAEVYDDGDPDIVDVPEDDDDEMDGADEPAVGETWLSGFRYALSLQSGDWRRVLEEEPALAPTLQQLWVAADGGLVNGRMDALPNLPPSAAAPEDAGFLSLETALREQSGDASDETRMLDPDYLIGAIPVVLHQLWRRHRAGAGPVAQAIASDIELGLSNRQFALTDELNERMQRYAVPAGGMSLEHLDGYWSAWIASGVEQSPLEQLDRILGPELVWGDADEARETLMAMLSYWKLISERINRKVDPEDQRCHPWIDFGDEQPELRPQGPYGRDYAQGFLEAIEEFPRSAKLLLMDPEAKHWMAPIEALVNGRSLEKRNAKLGFEERMGLIAELPECVQHLAGFWRAADLPAQAAPARAERLPGRNDPCPCGSGKKYKKCHGAPERLN